MVSEGLPWRSARFDRSGRSASQRSPQEPLSGTMMQSRALCQNSAPPFLSPRRKTHGMRPVIRFCDGASTRPGQSARGVVYLIHFPSNFPSQATIMLRRACGLIAALLFATVPAVAPSTALGQAPRLEPLPEPPPPPPSVATDSSDSPIRIGPGEQDKVEEVTVGGQRGMKVTTPQGGVYYMMPAPDDGVGTQPPGSRLRVPLWVIKEF